MAFKPIQPKKVRSTKELDVQETVKRNVRLLKRERRMVRTEHIGRREEWSKCVDGVGLMLKRGEYSKDIY